MYHVDQGSGDGGYPGGGGGGSGNFWSGPMPLSGSTKFAVGLDPVNSGIADLLLQRNVLAVDDKCISGKMNKMRACSDRCPDN